MKINWLRVSFWSVFFAVMTAIAWLISARAGQIFAALDVFLTALCINHVHEMRIEQRQKNHGWIERENQRRQGKAFKNQHDKYREIHP